MANPAIRSALGSYNTGPALLTLVAPSGIATGDWMLALIVDTMATSGTDIPAPDADWIALTTHQVMGTRNMKVFARRRKSTDGSSYAFTQSAASNAMGIIVAGPDGIVDPTQWIIGAYQRGATGSAGTTYVNGTGQTTPGITTTLPAGTLVISLQGESSSTTETDSQVTVSTAGWTKLLWYITGQSSPANSGLVAYKTMDTAGTPGDLVSAWLNSTANRGSIMIAIPPVVSATAVARVSGISASGAAPVAAAKVQVGKISAFGSGGIAIIPQAARTAEPYEVVTIAAAASVNSPTPSIWAWRQISGPTVALSGSLETLSFVAPASMTEQTLVFGVIGSLPSGLASPEQTFTVKVFSHTIFTLANGAWVPSSLGGISERIPVLPPRDDSAATG